MTPEEYTKPTTDETLAGIAWVEAMLRGELDKREVVATERTADVLGGLLLHMAGDVFVIANDAEDRQGVSWEQGAMFVLDRFLKNSRARVLAHAAEFGERS